MCGVVGCGVVWWDGVWCGGVWGGGVWCGMVWWDGVMTTNSGNLFLHFQTVGSFSCSYVSCNKFFHFLKPLKAPSTSHLTSAHFRT